MPEISVGENKNFRDLNPLFAGYEYCRPEHSFGPAVREYYLIHHVMAGKGTYYVEEKAYRMQKGDTFLIKPNLLTKYQADGEDPWYYVWIGFNGSLSEDFESLPPVIKLSPGFFHDIRRVEQVDSLRKEYLVSVLFQMYCQLFCDRKQDKDYVGEVYGYIRYNYMSDITIEGLADMVNLDRRYLSRQFKAKYGLPLKQFLIEFRMEKARQFLRDGMPVGHVSEMVGYRDICNFHKIFKKFYGKSPGEFRGDKAERNAFQPP